MRTWQAGLMLMIVAGILMALGGAEQVGGRPRDPWVFRCVLDKRPRMVVIALHKSLWVAYDATTCSLYKAWRGDVDLKGAVYTTEHGPQPTVRGQAIINETESTVWRLTVDNQSAAIKSVWKGYRFNDDQVTLLYELQFNDSNVLAVEERVDVEEVSEQRIKLVRQISVHSKQPNIQIAMNLPAAGPDRKAIQWKVNGAELQRVANQTTVAVELKPGETTTITAELDLPAMADETKGGAK